MSSPETPPPSTTVDPDRSRKGAAFPRGVGMPATRALAGAGYHDLDGLDGASASALSALHGVGPKAIGIIRDALAARGKALRA